MKNTKTYFIIIFLTIITIYGSFYSVSFNDISQIYQQSNFMEKLEQCCDHPYFEPTVRYLITLFGAVTVQIFALFKNFNGSIRFLRQFFPNRSETFYNRVNFCICTIVGSIIGFIFFSPQSHIGALVAGFGWQGAITAMMNREKKAPKGGTEGDNDRADDLVL